MWQALSAEVDAMFRQYEGALDRKDFDVQGLSVTLSPYSPEVRAWANERNRVWIACNRKRSREIAINGYYRNRERVLARQKAWRAANPELAREKDRRANERRKQSKQNKPKQLQGGGYGVAKSGE